MYITFDGIDGCGKSSSAKRLADSLGCLLVAQPSPDYLGPAIRRVLAGLTRASVAEMLYMFVGDRIALYVDVVMPELAKGHHVVCDRSAFSTYAYQGQGEHRKMVRELHNTVVPKTDLAFLLAIEPTLAQNRLKESGKQDIFDTDLALQVKAAELYIEAANKHYECFTNDIEVIDGSQSLNAIAKEVLEVVRACEGVHAEP